MRVSEVVSMKPVARVMERAVLRLSASKVSAMTLPAASVVWVTLSLAS
ncbi:MAG: hypothetical protein ACT4PV_02275 [Planctomycetaceae bacterium]